MGSTAKFDPESGFFKNGPALRKYQQVCYFCERHPLETIGHNELKCKNCGRNYAKRERVWESTIIARGPGRPSNAELAERAKREAEQAKGTIGA